MYNTVDLVIEVNREGIVKLSLGDYSGPSNAPTAVEMDEIRSYIDMFNKSDQVRFDNKFLCNKTCKCEVYLCFYNESYLTSILHGARIIEDEQPWIEFNSFSGYDFYGKDEIIYTKPTIHLTKGDIFIVNDTNNKKGGEPNKRYARYMDSSIWNYYVPILIKNEETIEPCENGEILSSNYDFTPLESVLNEIICNYLNNRYQLRVAQEYAHLFSRIVNQSFLPDISGGHGKAVSPFLFHSERKSSEDLKKGEHIEILSKIKQYQWRFLLVDDHCTEKMAVVDGKIATLNKLDIVKTELENLFDEGSVATKKEEITDKTFIYIDCASNLEEAMTALQNKKYEIILLDYLLGEKGNGREYGYELLKGIWYKENKDNLEKERKEELEKLYKEYVFDYKKGPDNRFYFMFISAFTTAVSERLLTEGWLRSEEYWYIGEGACPVNTPYLFQYRLLHIMEKRLKEMGLAKWDVKKKKEQNDSSKNENAKKKPFACLLKTIHETFTKEVVEDHNNIYTDLIKEIYSSKDEARQRANEKFQDILDLLYHYKSLIKDTHITENCFDSNESVLATEFIKKHMNYEGVLEHLTQLVYLTAFGTVRQWPEMWEEYQYIKSVLGKIEEVEIYIVDLKNNSAK